MAELRLGPKFAVILQPGLAGGGKKWQIGQEIIHLLTVASVCSPFYAEVLLKGLTHLSIRFELR